MNIKDYLHLYMGCEMQCTNPKCYGDNERYGQRRTLSHLLFDKYTNGNWKPRLRPISDLTAKEASDLEWEMWDHIPDFCFGDREMTVEMFVNSRTENRPGFTVFVKAINWLRSNGFDCDGLIDAGHALDKTKHLQRP